MKRILAALLLGLPAQTQAGRSELLCPIVAIRPYQNVRGLYQLELDCGSFDGVFATSRLGYPLRPYLQGQDPVPELHSRRFYLEQLQFLSSRARLELPLDDGLIGKDGLVTLAPGDLIPVEIKALTLPAPQALYELSRLGIVFSNLDGVPWVLYRDYRKQPRHDFEAERLPLMLAEVHELADYADQTYGREPLGDGVFAGKTLGQAMAASTLADLHDFLAFVQAFPGKFLGRQWKFAEVYATWILNGAPGPDDPDTEVIPEDIEPSDPDEQMG
ncbi:MAG TPA: hypothetical protein V6D23_08875 [Candidatus Obscuribacterales bacterium]